MNAVTPLPGMPRRCARIVANARLEAEAEARKEATERARKAIRNPKGISDETLRTACMWFMAHGDGGPDYLLADQHLFAINRRQQIARNTAKCKATLAALQGDDTPLDVLKAHRDRWPEILIGAAFGAVVILKIAGWA